MKYISSAIRFSALCCLLFISKGMIQAAPKDAGKLSGSDIMPDFVTAYAEMNHPAKLIDTLKSHPVYQKISQLEQFKAISQNPDLVKLKLVSNVIAAQLQMDIESTIKALTGQGIYLGFDAQTQIWVAATKAKDAGKLQEITDTVLDLVHLDGMNKKHKTINQYQYRNVDVYSGQFNRAYACVHGPWMVMSNQKDGIHKIIDLMIDQPQSCLSHVASFKTVKQKIAGKTGNIGMMYGHMDVLRKMGVGEKLAKGKPDHPMQELLFGVLHESFKHSDIMGAGIHLDQKQLGFQIATPFDHKKMSPGREYAFSGSGKDGNGGGAPAPIIDGDTVFALSGYRDLAGFWNSADSLFNENIAANMAQKDSELSTLFGGQSFSSETLPAIQPGLQFVASQYKAIPGQPEPAIKLPAFALVGELKNKSQRQQFQIAFQSLISFLNINAGQQGRPAMMLNNQNDGDTIYMTGKYMSMGMQSSSSKTNAPMHYNFTPTIALTGNNVIISSTETYARKLVKSVNSGKPHASANTIVKLDGPNTTQLLKTNLEHLVAQQILEDGKTEAQAREDLGLMLKVAELIQDAELTYHNHQGLARLDFNIRFK